MSGKESHAVVGGEERNSRFHISKKLIVLILAAIVLIGGLAYAWIISRPEETHTTSKAQQKTIDEAAYKTTLNPDYATAEKELKLQLKDTSDKKKQADIYTKLAAVALQQGQYQKAIDDELAASKADPSRAGLYALTIADAYAKLGNKTEALKYYQKALDFYSSQPDNYNSKASYVGYLKGRIAELQK